jgi:rhamnulose-1-phosphate aldolase
MQEANLKYDIRKAPFLKEMMDTTHHMWRFGWDERNGGNISRLLTEDEVAPYVDLKQTVRLLPLHFPVAELAGRYFIVTGSGKYFKNVKDNPEDTLGLIRVNDAGTGIEVLWGLANGGNPTSELPAHFMSHIARLKVDDSHRVIMHNHATNIIAMTFTHELEENSFTRTLWQMCTECVVVFPDGIGVLPWMVPGTKQIGEQTARKMAEHRLVVWPHHGIFGSGSSMDEAFGLIETAEKAATIYMLIGAHQGGVKQTITDRELAELAQAFGVIPRPGILQP